MFNRIWIVFAIGYAPFVTAFAGMADEKAMEYAKVISNGEEVVIAEKDEHGYIITHDGTSIVTVKRYKPSSMK